MNRIVLGIGALVLVAVGAVTLFLTRDTGPDVTMEDAEVAYARGDIATVVNILTELIAEDEPLALYRLGLMTRDGEGVSQDRDRAVSLLERAWNAGHEPSQAPLRALYLHRGLEAEAEDGVVDLTRAAELGSTQAQAIVGSYYLTGTFVDEDLSRAITLLGEAADAGDSRAQTNLGMAYATGRGVERNDEEAFRWYLAAAQQGMVRAQPAVGLFYETGRGVEQNVGEALRWYLTAYRAGAPNVDARLGALLADGMIEGADLTEASAWAAAWK